MKNIWIKYKMWIMIFGYAALIFFGVYFLAVPLIAGINSSSNQMQEQLVDQQMEDSQISQLPKMDEDWNSIQSKQDDLNIILDKENEVAFIENIEAIASKTNNSVSLNIEDNLSEQEVNKLKQVSKSKDKNVKGIMDNISHNSFFPVQINLIGDYLGLVNFIHMLENSHIYVNIISIQSKKEEVKDKNSSQDNLFAIKEGLSSEEDSSSKEVLNSVISAIVYTKK
jgi:hypothetical protein